MSWTEIAPRAKPTYQPFAPVEFAVGRPLGLSKTERQSIVTLTFRPGKLEGHPTFLTAGSVVKVFAGTGEHLGMLRIVPGPGYRISKPGGSAGALGTTILRFPLPPGVLAERGKSEPEFDYGENWLEVTIPAWALDQSSIVSDQSAELLTRVLQPLPTKAPPTRKTFASALDGVKHDVRRGS